MNKEIKISKIVISIILLSLSLLIIKNTEAAETISIPVSAGESVTIYEATGNHYEYNYSVSELMINGGSFSTNANEHYAIASNGIYLEIKCFRDSSLSGHRVGNNIVAVRLNGVSGYPDGIWASSIIDYKLGYNGIAESRFNILGDASAAGPYENSPCTYLGDQNSEITVGFSVDQRTVSELRNDIRNIQEKLVLLLKQLLEIYQEKISELQGTSNWQTYRNEEYGFEINYPKEWQDIEEKKEEWGFYVYFQKKLSSPSTHLVIGVNAVFDFPEAFARCASSEEIEIAGIKRRKTNHWSYASSPLELTPEQCEQDSQLTNIYSSIKTEDSLYEFAFFCKEEEWEGAEGREKCNDLYDQILSTFRFIEGGTTAQEQACIDSGGTVDRGMCCFAVNDFPNLCLIGACGCSPENSHEVKICDCGEGKCFNGNTCVAIR